MVCIFQYSLFYLNFHFICILLLSKFILSQCISLFYSDEASKVKKKLQSGRGSSLLQPSLSKRPKGDKNEEEDSGGDESNSEMRRKA
jgi:hypothetical protein